MEGLLGGAAVLAAPRTVMAYDAPLSPDRRQYAILINGRDSGRHTVHIEPLGEICMVTIRSTAAVRLLAVPIFHYDHASREFWQGRTLSGFESRTDDNGRALRVGGRGTASGFLVEVAGKIAMLPSDVAPATYWNRAILERAYVLDPEDGRLFRQHVGPQRTAALDWTGAGAVTEVDVTSIMSGVVWYGAGGEFVGCRFKKDRHDIEFRALPA
jgi:hypothetical protein